MAHRARRIVIFYMRERSKKVTILRAQYALTGSEVRFPPVERSDHVERPLDGAPGQPYPVAVQPLERAVVVLHHHEQVIDVDLLIVLIHHPVAEIRVGGVGRLQQVAGVIFVLWQAHEHCERHDEQHGPITAPKRAGVQKEVLASVM